MAEEPKPDSIAHTDLAKPIVEEGVKLLDSLFGRSFKIAGEMLADQFHKWQWQNRIRIAARAEQILKQNKIASRVLPKGFLLNFVEKAGNVEDETLQEIWARLLAAAVANDDRQDPLLLSVAERFMPSDAKLLDKLSKEVTQEWSNHDDLGMQRLRALGLLNNKLQERTVRPGDPIQSASLYNLVFTGIAKQLIAAIQTPSK